MVITATEFKSNMGKYLAMVAHQDIFISKNGKNIAKLTSPTVDKVSALNSLVGIIPDAAGTDENELREERLSRQ